MKKKTVIRVSIYTLLVILILAIGLVISTMKRDDRAKEFTSYNKNGDGTKALYFLTERMGYRTMHHNKSARFLVENAVLVAIEPSKDDFTDKTELKYIKSWLERGNDLVLTGGLKNIDDYKLDEIAKLDETDKSKDYLVYIAGKGRIFFINNSEAFKNSSLKAEDEAAVEFISLLDSTGKKNILFNEYYHGIKEENFILFDIMGTTATLIVIQLLIGLVITLIVKADRLGNPVTVFEIEKRKENENMYALANIYNRSRAYEIVMKIFANRFTTALRKYLGLNSEASEEEIISRGINDKYLSRYDLQRLLYNSKHIEGSNSKKIKKLAKLAGTMERIRKEI